MTVKTSSSIKNRRKRIENKSPELWQYPFVDVLRYVCKDQGLGLKIQGKVRRDMDRLIGRQVYRISGAVPAVNYVEVPSKRVWSLGLTGRYLYLQLRVPDPEKYFMLHIEVVTASGLSIRFSFSNMFSEFKSIGRVLKIPMGWVGQRFCIVALDLKGVLEHWTSYTFYALKSVQLCSMLIFRAMFTSDIMYGPENLPREMAWPVSKDQNWFDLYDFFQFPDNVKEPSPVVVDALPGGSTHPDGQYSAQCGLRIGSMPQREIPTSILRSIDSKPKGCVIGTPMQVVVREHSDEQQTSQSYTKDGIWSSRRRPYASPRNSPKMKGNRHDCIERQLYDLMNDPETEEDGIPIFANTPTVVPELADDIDDSKTPSMELKRVIGFSGHFARALAWPQNSRQILYPCNNMVVSLDLSTSEQTFLKYPGKGKDICVVTVSNDGVFVATGEDGKNTEIRIWRLTTSPPVSHTEGLNKVDRTPKYIATVPPLFSKYLCSLSFSHDDRFLAGCGKDKGGRVLLAVWDVSQLKTFSGKPSKLKIELLAKQVSEFSVNRLSFSPYYDFNIVTVGRQSIRIWRIIDRHLRGSSVTLGEHSRKVDQFNDLCFEAIYGMGDDTNKKIFVASSSGSLFVIDYSERQLICIYKDLHTGPINSVIMNQGFCVTGSEDKLVRVWPLDFSQHFLEAEHDSPITSVALSSDGLEVAVATQSGSIGILDVTKHEYQTKIRSCIGQITSVAVGGEMFATACMSEQSRITVWSLTTLEELIEFGSPDVRPTQVVFSPIHPNTLASGSQLGNVRIFDIEQAGMLVEYKQHSWNITALVFSPDGRKLFSGALDGVVCVYDALRNFQPVNVIGEGMDGQLRMIDLGISDRFLAVCRTPIKDEGQIARPSGLPAAPARALVNLYETSQFCKTGTIAVKGARTTIIMPSGASASGDFVFGGTKVALHPGTNELLAVTDGGRFQRMDSFTQTPIAESWLEKKGGRQGGIISLAVSPGGGYIAVGTKDGKVALTTYQTSSLARKSDMHINLSGPVTSLAFDKRFKLLLSSSRDTVFVWAPKNIEEPVFGQNKVNEAAVISTAPTDYEIGLDDLFGVHWDGGRGTLRGSIELADKHEPLPVPMPTPTNFVKCRFHYDHGARDYVNGNIMPPKTQERSSEKSSVLQRVYGYNGNGRHNARWIADKGWLVYTVGCLVVRDDLHDRSQLIGTGHAVHISTLAVSPNGLLIATGSGCEELNNFGVIRLWELATMQCVEKLECHKKGVQALAFTHDSNRIVSVGTFDEHGSDIVVWDMSSYHFWRETCPCAPFDCLAVSGRIDRFITISSNQAHLWTTKKGTTRKTIFQEGLACTLIGLNGPKGIGKGLGIRAMAALDQDYVAFVLTDGRVAEWKITTNSLRKDYGSVNGDLSCAFCVLKQEIDNNHVVLVQIGSTVHRTVVEQAIEQEVTGSVNIEGFVVSSSFEPTGNIGIIGTSKGSLWYINFVQQRGIRLVSSFIGSVTTMEVDPLRDVCITGTALGLVHVVDCRPQCFGTHILHFQANGFPVTALTVDPFRKSDAMRLSVNVAHVKDLESEGWILDVGGRIGIGYGNGTVKLVNIVEKLVTDSFELSDTKAAITQLVFANEGKLLLAGLLDGSIFFINTWDTRGGDSKPRVVPFSHASEMEVARVDSMDVSKEQPGIWLVAFGNSALCVFSSDWGSGEPCCTKSICSVVLDSQLYASHESAEETYVKVNFIGNSRIVVSIPESIFLRIYDYSSKMFLQDIKLPVAPTKLVFDNLTSPLLTAALNDAIVTLDEERLSGVAVAIGEQSFCCERVNALAQASKSHRVFVATNNHLQVWSVR